MTIRQLNKEHILTILATPMLIIGVIFSIFLIGLVSNILIGLKILSIIKILQLGSGVVIVISLIGLIGYVIYDYIFPELTQQEIKQLCKTK